MFFVGIVILYSNSQQEKTIFESIRHFFSNYFKSIFIFSIFLGILGGAATNYILNKIKEKNIGSNLNNKKE